MPRLEPLITYADCAKCSADVARRRCAIGLISNARWIVCKSVSGPNLLCHIRYAQILGYSDTEMPRYSDTYTCNIGVFMLRCRVCLHKPRAKWLWLCEMIFLSADRFHFDRCHCICKRREETWRQLENSNSNSNSDGDGDVPGSTPPIRGRLRVTAAIKRYRRQCLIYRHTFSNWQVVYKFSCICIWHCNASVCTKANHWFDLAKAKVYMR